MVSFLCKTGMCYNSPRLLKYQYGSKLEVQRSNLLRDSLLLIALGFSTLHNPATNFIAQINATLFEFNSTFTLGYKDNSKVEELFMIHSRNTFIGTTQKHFVVSKEEKILRLLQRGTQTVINWYQSQSQCGPQSTYCTQIEKLQFNVMAWIYMPSASQHFTIQQRTLSLKIVHLWILSISSFFVGNKLFVGLLEKVKTKEFKI